MAIAIDPKIQVSGKQQKKGEQIAVSATEGQAQRRNSGESIFKDEAGRQLNSRDS